MLAEKGALILHLQVHGPLNLIVYIIIVIGLQMLTVGKLMFNQSNIVDFILYKGGMSCVENSAYYPIVDIPNCGYTHLDISIAELTN